MLIQELERLTGLARPTIRYYEKEGLVEPIRSENGYRCYSDADVQNLIRIKLMRQLGVSLEKIKQLQKGTERFAAVMDAQIKTLTTQIEHDKRAKAVCTAILNDKAEYATLNADYYLRMFDSVIESKTPAGDFQEEIPDSIHPWRRFGARTLDYFALGILVQFILIVVLRIRPIPGNSRMISILLQMAVGAIFIPIEALLLHLWGTTPGKLVFGIRIERIEGGRLSFSDALERAKMVFLSGVGLRIPIVSEVVMFLRYCTLTGRSFWRWAKYDSVSPPYDMDWDYNNEIHYDEGVGKRRAALISVVVLLAVLFSVNLFDSVKPKYRSNDLTVAEFASNYNSYAELLYKNSEDIEKLSYDGTWIEEEGSYVIHVGATPAVENQDFLYESENDHLRSVAFSQQWKDVTILTPFDVRCYIAALTLYASQEGRSYRDITRFQEQLAEAIEEPSGSFQYDNVKVEWEIDASKELTLSGSTYYSLGDQTGEIQFHFSASIIDANT